MPGPTMPAGVARILTQLQTGGAEQDVKLADLHRAERLLKDQVRQGKLPAVEAFAYGRHLRNGAQSAQIISQQQEAELQHAQSSLEQAEEGRRREQRYERAELPEDLLSGIRTVDDAVANRRATDDMVNRGLLSVDEGQRLVNQINEHMNRLVLDGSVRISEDAARWLGFTADTQERDARESMVQDALDAQRSRDLVMQPAEFADTLKDAMQDSGLTLKGLGLMYTSAREAQSRGLLTSHQRNQVIGTLESNIRDNDGVLDFSKVKVAPGSNALVAQALGGERTADASAFSFPDPLHVQAYVAGVTQEGVTSRSQRNQLLALVIRSGDAKVSDLAAMQQALNNAAGSGHIDLKQARQAWKVLAGAAAPHLQGESIADLTRRAQVVKHGAMRFRG